MKWSRYALSLAILGDIGLIISLFVIAGHGTDRLLIAAIFSIPLLIALNGLARVRVYTAAWVSMASLFYLAYAMVEYIAGAGTLGVDLCLAASLGLFVGSVVFARLNSRENP